MKGAGIGLHKHCRGGKESGVSERGKRREGGKESGVSERGKKREGGRRREGERTN